MAFAPQLRIVLVVLAIANALFILYAWGGGVTLPLLLSIAYTGALASSAYMIDRDRREATLTWSLAAAAASSSAGFVSYAASASARWEPIVMLLAEALAASALFWMSTAADPAQQSRRFKLALLLFGITHASYAYWDVVAFASLRHLVVNLGVVLVLGWAWLALDPPSRTREHADGATGPDSS